LGKTSMPRLNLTQRAIAKLPAPHPDGVQTIYWDEELRGFGVQCSGKTNQKLFIAQRDVGGRTRRIGARTAIAMLVIALVADRRRPGRCVPLMINDGIVVLAKRPRDRARLLSYRRLRAQRRGRRR
jgi:hypothetical protein